MESTFDRLQVSAHFWRASVELIPDPSVQLCEGDGLVLSFRAPDGVAYTVFGIVRRLQLEVVQCSPPLPGGALGRVHARATLKFRITPLELGLHVILCGQLTAIHAEALGRQLQQCARRCVTQPLPFLLDATALKTSPEDALPSLRHALALLRESRPTIGVVVGPSSIALSQLMRLLREADIADGVAFTDDPIDAVGLWGVIISELRGSSRRASLEVA